MMKYWLFPYICGQLQGQLQIQGLWGSIFVVVCGVIAFSVYLRLWRHIRPIRERVKSRNRYKRSAGPRAKPLVKNVETLLASDNTKWERSIVKPTNPPAPHVKSLSNLDRVVNPTFSSIILFFVPRKSNTVAGKLKRFLAGVLSVFFPSVSNKMDESTMSEASTISEKLKASLADVLSVYHEFAGRLAVGEDGLVNLLCNSAGAVVLEVYVPEDLSALGDLRPMHALSGLNSNHVTSLIGRGPPYLPDQLSPMPVFICQITWFKCGSFALGGNWHHTVADGTSGCQFMESWAEVSSGKIISQMPNHERANLLRPRNPLDPSRINQNSYSNESVTATSLQNKDQKQAVVHVAYISGEKVDEIRAQVAREAKQYPEYAARGRPYSRAECTSAFMWNLFVTCRYANMKVELDRITRFFAFCDGRAKGRLNLMRAYFGNVVCSACAVTTEKKLHSRPLIYAASLIQKAMEGVDGEYFRSLIDWVETHGLRSSSNPEHVNSLGQDVAATFWNRFNIYGMDFGWGKPAFGARNSPPRNLIDGFAVMPSNTGNKDDMVVLINLQGDRLERLLQNETFRYLVDE